MEGSALNVAVFSDSALPILNGVSVSIDALIQGLRDKGHSVHLFTSGFPGHKELDPNTHRFTAINTIFAKGYPVSIPPFYPMLAEFRRHKFDIIHTHTPFTVGFVGLRWAESHGIPIVSTYHTHYDKYTHYIPLLPKPYLRYKIAKHTNFYYNNVDRIITPSDASLRWLRRHNVRKPISVVPTRIPVPRDIDQAAARARLGARADQRVMLYVGRIAVEKNIGTLIKAAKIAMAEDPSLHLWFVGDGPALEGYRRMIGSMGIGDRVSFFGFVPRHEVDEFYAAADVFVFPSMTETQGLVVIEAMSYGLPAVVVTGGGAGSAIRNGKNGFLVKNDPMELARAIGKALENESTYNLMSQSATADAREFSVPVMVNRVLDVYRQAIHPEEPSTEVVHAG